MLAKIGRPKSENARDIRFTFRMNAGEYEMLETICKITEKNKNDAIRCAVERYYKYLKRNK